MFLRLSVPGGSAPGEIEDYLSTLPDPVYGGQLQDFAAPGQAAEGRMVDQLRGAAGDAGRRHGGHAAGADAIR